MLNGLDLFSGIGGLAYALGPYVLPLAYCENERYAQAVLLSRMYDGELPKAPIWDDVRTLSAAGLPSVDIIVGGFPCQDISAAGRGAGLDGERSGLYWQLHRIISEARPAYVFLENVPAIRTRGLDTVVRSLADLGYDCRWTLVSAAEVGAPHLRERWFLLAHAQGERRIEGRPELRVRRRKTTNACSGGGGGGAMGDSDSEGQLQPRRSGLEERERHRNSSTALGDASSARSQRQTLTQKAWSALAEHRYTSKRDWPSWLPEPALPRGDHGLLFRVDRTHGLGNAVVPIQAQIAYQRLMGYTIV